jgi:hypothetical protein
MIDGAIWHVTANGQSPGADRYKLSESLDLWLYLVQIVTASATTIKSDMAPGTQSFDLKIQTPTSPTTREAQTIAITASVVSA